MACTNYKAGATWRAGKKAHFKSGSTWREAKKIWYKAGSTWKSCSSCTSQREYDHKYSLSGNVFSYYKYTECPVEVINKDKITTLIVFALNLGDQEHPIFTLYPLTFHPKSAYGRYDTTKKQYYLYYYTTDPTVLNFINKNRYAIRAIETKIEWGGVKIGGSYHTEDW